MKSTIETIDKELAQKYLAQRDDDRPVSRAHLNYLMGRQLRGEWRANGESIKFDKSGKLRDGQHRLMMVLETATPIECVVVRDIDSDAFITMDTGKKRNLADILAIKKFAYPKALASTTAWVYRYLTNRMIPAGGTSHEMYLGLINSHPTIQNSVSFVTNLKHPAGSPGWTATAMACHYLFCQVNKTLADDFIEKYVTGLRLQEPTDPIAILRGQVISLATARIRPQTPQIFGLFALAWNATRNNRPQRQNFLIRPLSNTRPKIDGFPKTLSIEGETSLFPNGDEEES